MKFAIDITASMDALDDWIIGMEERRFDERVRVSKPAKILLPHGAPLACSVRNISRGGAKIVIADAGLVPAAFALEIAGEPGRRPCEVVRRTDGEIGIRFRQAMAA